MIWHVIVRVGSDDQYMPEVPKHEPQLFVSIDAPGDPFEVKNNVFEEVFARVAANPLPEVIDLLSLAFSVYATDLKISRNLSQDRWMRDLTLYVPVQSPERWAGNALLIQQMLNFLTGDRWELHFRQRQTQQNWHLQGKSTLKIDVVSLFSGGLDSLVGAIDLLEEGKHVALVSHHGAGITGSIQQKVLEELSKEYGDRITSYNFYVQPPKKRTGKGEPSMRSRSFLFLSLGTFVTNLFSTEVPLIVGENGLISLNVPLTQSRVGSLSTRTTHPHFVSLYRKVLSALGLNTPVELPYQFLTKGEMLGQSKNQKLLNNLVSLTMSCSHPESGRYRRNAPAKHCGYCVPCIIRRAALASVHLDQENYNIDVLKEPPRFDSVTGRDFRAFQMAVERHRSSNSYKSLFTVLNTGPLPPDEIKDHISVYMRGMEEIFRFLSSTLS